MEIIIFRREALAKSKVRYFTGKPCKYGHRSERWSSDGKCVECTRVFQTERKEIYYARHKIWRDKNKQKVKDWNDRWRFKNPEKKAQISKHWVIKNRDRVNKQKIANEAKRRAFKLKSQGTYTVDQISKLFRAQCGNCANCFSSIEDGWHNDHITPLSKGGRNDIENIQLLCQSCNNRKYNKDPFVWARQNGRLL